jgi:hypothetical protein
MQNFELYPNQLIYCRNETWIIEKTADSGVKKAYFYWMGSSFPNFTTKQGVPQRQTHPVGVTFWALSDDTRKRWRKSVQQGKKSEIQANFWFLPCFCPYLSRKQGVPQRQTHPIWVTFWALSDDTRKRWRKSVQQGESLEKWENTMDCWSHVPSMLWYLSLGIHDPIKGRKFHRSIRPILEMVESIGVTPLQSQKFFFGFFNCHFDRRLPKTNSGWDKSYDCHLNFEISIIVVEYLY